LTVGEAADCKANDGLIGLSKTAQAGQLFDKCYGVNAIRAILCERKIKSVILGRSNFCVKIEHDRAFYKQQNRIERGFGHF